MRFFAVSLLALLYVSAVVALPSSGSPEGQVGNVEHVHSKDEEIKTDVTAMEHGLHRGLHLGHENQNLSSSKCCKDGDKKIVPENKQDSLQPLHTTVEELSMNVTQPANRTDHPHDSQQQPTQSPQ